MENTKDISNKKWRVYIHIVPKAISSYDYDKYYVGITNQKNITGRWKSGDGYKTQPFYRAIQKYGWDNFEHEIIAENLTEDEAKNFEIFLIKELGSKGKYGYNMTFGGDGVTGVDRCGEKNSFYGKMHTEETKEKMSKSRAGKYTGETNSFYGKKHTDDCKIKMSLLRKDFFKNNPEKICVNKPSKEQIQEIKKRHSKPVLKFSEKMELIEEFDSLADAERIGYRSASIRDACIGKKETYKGFIWRYKYKEDESNGIVHGTKRDDIYCLNNELKLVSVFKSFSEASRSMGVNRNHISSACNSNRHYSYGYYWIFKSDYEELESSSSLFLLEENKNVINW